MDACFHLQQALLVNVHCINALGAMQVSRWQLVGQFAACGALCIGAKCA